MHTILLHIAGIAILEIGFFFYYIGPMETKMFEHTISILARDPIHKLDDLIITNKIMYSDTQHMLFSLLINQTDSNDITDIELINMRDNDKTNRENKNHKLFILAIVWWIGLVVLSIIVFLLHYYNSRKKVPLSNYDDKSGSRFLNIEPYDVIDIESNRTRKTSNDYTDTTLFSSQNTNEIIFCGYTCHLPFQKKTFYYVTKYILFGVCVLSFQFVFFQNIVLYYDPLSIGEMKYIIYNLMRYNLDNYQSH